jgi:hypothetical protein
MDNAAARYTLAELERIVLSFNDRLVVIEDRLGLPMSAVDRAIARDIARRREEALLADARRNEAFRQAQAEAEKVGHRGPLDIFTRKLNAGEFEPPRSRPNGG